MNLTGIKVAIESVALLFITTVLAVLWHEPVLYFLSGLFFGVSVMVLMTMAKEWSLRNE